MRKRFIAAAVSVIAAVGLFAEIPMGFSDTAGIAITASAAKSDFVIETDADGDKYIAGYTGNGGDITIPDDVVWIGEKAFYNNDNITSVTIPESCWYWIDRRAFALCSKLKTVTVEGNIDGIGDEAFFACKALEKVTFKGNVGRGDGSGGIGGAAFSNCSALKTVSFSKRRATVDMIGGCAFSDCTSLTSINLPTGLGAIYGDAFVNCESLIKITVPEAAAFNGEHIFGYMYGKETPQSACGYFKADGSSQIYALHIKGVTGNSAEKGDYMTQQAITMSVAKGSAAEKYAKANDISYEYAAAADTAKTDDKLPAPKNIRANKGTDKIILKWDAVDGADGYRVYMYNEATGKYDAYKSIKSTKCTVDGLTSGASYKFKIAALERSGGKYNVGTPTKELTAETQTL
ncbi:MAG: fibronectin type III domain-containing protein [Oscillospiraceae bacterium]|nr:fibronectin type III domain-containing protein [Oscillospiraceae bacterium]